MHLALPLLSLLSTTVLAIPQPPYVNTTGRNLPSHYAVLLFDGYQPWDVYPVLDVINLKSSLIKETIHLSLLSRTLDPVSSIPRTTATHNMTHSFGSSVLPTDTFEKVINGSADGGGGGHGHSGAGMGSMKGDIDVLIVPGGMGTRENMDEEIEFVRAIYPKVKFIISVCTGATILARSGILDNRNATTNKRSWEWATSTGPNVNWVPSARWVVDGNIWSSSGVSAGVDVTFAWVEHLYGKELADYTARSLEYERWVGGASYDPYGKYWEVPGAV